MSGVAIGATVRLAGPTAVNVAMAGVETPPTLLAIAVTLLGPDAKVRLAQAEVPDAEAVVTQL